MVVEWNDTKKWCALVSNSSHRNVVSDGDGLSNQSACLLSAQQPRMARDISTGIDIGTSHVKVVIAEKTREKDREFLRIIGTGYAESEGLRHGYIVQSTETAASIKAAVADAEKMADVKVSRAFLGIGGVGLDSITAWGSAVVSRGDGEITDLDIEKAAEAARLTIHPTAIQNRKIIREIPLQYKIDNKEVYGEQPLGLKGLKLEVKIFFVTCLEQHFESIIKATEEACIEVEDVMASPLAASLVSLTKTQKIAGVVLANVGAETTSIVVYENGLPISLEVFSLGANNITNDIALGLRISLEEAEQIKLGAITETPVPKKKFDEIVEARLEDIFDLVEAHLKKINRSALLPAGIVLTGGGSSPSSIEESARAALRLPAHLPILTTPAGSKAQIKDGSWSVAHGLSIWGFTGDVPREPDTILLLFKKIFRSMLRSLKPLLP